MNTIAPVAIVLSLGVGLGLIPRRWLSNIWIPSIVAGIATIFLWGIGMEVLFKLTSPDEDMGATHYEGILTVFLTASIASLVALKLLSMKGQTTNRLARLPGKWEPLNLARSLLLS